MKRYLLLSLCLWCFFIAKAQEPDKEEKSLKELITKDLCFSGQWFLSFNQSQEAGVTQNAFTLKRGYFTFKKDFNDYLSLRFTQDITLDQEGSDAGNVEMRFKYCYLKIKNNYFKPLHNTYFEIGLVHRPWIDFEQKINTYRVQGKMFMERYDLISSADFGLLFTGLIGGTIDEEKLEGLSSSHPGKYGSYSFGIFNGGGYHAMEYNNNKILEARISLRPLPNIVPGLQISYNTGYGKGNIVEKPNFNFHHACLSYENKFSVISLQAYTGEGNYEGSYVDTNFVSFSSQGYSAFTEFKIPRTKLALFGRYDYFVLNDNTDLEYNSYIGGIAYRFFDKSKIIVDIDYMETPGGDEYIYEVALDIRF